MTNPDFAFARPHSSTPYQGAIPSQDGLTKREYFAAMALQGICCNVDNFGNSEYELARAAVTMADELIKALNK